MSVLMTAGEQAGEGLVVLTRDESLMQTLEAVAPEHALSFLTDEADLATHLAGGHIGVAILDAASIRTPIAELTERMRKQFPDLVLIVAGGHEHQAAVSTLVTRGTVYRFLHKPVSAQRVKLFVEAAWRRHDVEHATSGTFAALPPIAAPSEPTVSRGTVWAGGIAVLVVLCGGLWLALRSGTSKPVVSPTRTASPPVSTPLSSRAQIEQLLTRADAALEQGALAPPAPNNAADLYREALRHDSANARAREGLERVVDRLLNGAEQELLAEQVDAAARLTDEARAIQPDNLRVAFLTSQLGKERERVLLAQARAAAASGDIRHALAVLDSAAPQSRQSPLVATVRRQIEEQQVDARVGDFLQQAQQRERSGALIEPPQNNARFFIESAAALAPDEPNVRKAEKDLGRRLLTQARSDTQAGRPDDADRLLEAANSVGAPTDDIAALRRDAQNVRLAAKASSMARTTQLFNERLAQGKLVEPTTDSASFYLARLVDADPTHPSTVLARDSLASRLLQEARGATERKDVSAAEDLVSQARKIGGSAADVASAERAIAAVRADAGSAPDTLAASKLERIRYVAPIYPETASAAGRSGTVDLEFTVRADGSVGDVAVMKGDPPGVFDAAATDAVRKWRFKPPMRDGHTADQRVRLRMRFAVQ
jgi:TonB family protein